MAKRVLITGANRGLGRAIALRLARSGFEVCLHYRSGRSEALQVQEEIAALSQRPGLIQFDSTQREEVCAVLEEEVKQHGAFYGVVCNAGITKDNAFPAMPPSDWDAVLRTNLDAFYNVLHPLIMPMIQARQGGRIVTVASVSGILGNRGQVNYSASKAGLIGATKALALELAKRKITCNAVAPGLIETEMVSDLPQEQLLQHIPMRRMGKPEEVAGMVNFLFSDEAAYVTRQVLAVDGGLS